MNSQNIPHFDNPLNYKLIGVIVFLAIALQVFLFTASSAEEEYDFISYFYTSGSLAAGILGLIVAKKYWGSEVFGKANLALGLGFLFLFAGDITWNYYEFILEIDPYPSVADAFFLAFPVGVSIHLILNIRYFKQNLGKGALLGAPALTLILIIVYAISSFEVMEGHTFDFYFGLVYILSSSVMLSLAFLGVIIFRSSILGPAWLLLTLGILLFTISDTWYYYLELAEEFDLNHPTNTLWILSFMMVVYALYKHKKTI